MPRQRQVSALAAFGAGRVSDRLGPKRTLLATLVLWIVAIMAITLASWVLFVAQPILYFALGATLTLGPVLIIALSPSEKITEFMGFFVMVGNVSTVIAPGIVALLLGVLGDSGREPTASL